MARHNELGAWGERLAREYLISKGYTLVDENLHVGHNELDIIATKDKWMVFVEVKTRSRGLDEAVEAVDSRKIARMVRAADAVLRQYTVPYEYRFDVIAVIGTPEGEHRLYHYPDAFMPPLMTY